MKQTPAKNIHNVDVISRNNSNVTQHFAGTGSTSVSVDTDSIVLVHVSSGEVVRYVRHGNDLLIYLKDGSFIECKGYFQSETNELAFEVADVNGIEHVTFETAPS
ncbi:BapA prefix-like domain-containing protein [Atlantibacter subterraneus]|nr:BapA prefix-like domain-containing protein [Atlantibacter subterranea]